MIASVGTFHETFWTGHRARSFIDIDDMQFGLISGKCAMKAIFIIHQIQEIYFAKRKTFYLTYIDLEKAVNCIPSGCSRRLVSMSGLLKWSWSCTIIAGIHWVLITPSLTPFVLKSDALGLCPQSYAFYHSYISSFGRFYSPTFWNAKRLHSKNFNKKKLIWPLTSNSNFTSQHIQRILKINLIWP